MKKITLILALACFAMTVSSNLAYSQGQKKTIERKLTGQAVDKTRGANPNIKEQRPTTDVKQSKTRGESTCEIYFENFSGLYVDVYVDGKYMGTLNPYGSLTVYAFGGYATIYCLSTGGTRSWSDSGSCDGYYHYKLY